MSTLPYKAKQNFGLCSGHSWDISRPANQSVRSSLSQRGRRKGQNEGSERFADAFLTVIGSSIPKEIAADLGGGVIFEGILHTR